MCKCVGVCVRACVCAYVGLRVCECMCVRACVLVCVRMYACVYVQSEGMNYTFGQTCHIFVAAWYARNVFHVYIITINYCQIWKVLVPVDQLCRTIVPVSMARLP